MEKNKRKNNFNLLRVVITTFVLLACINATNLSKYGSAPLAELIGNVIGQIVAGFIIAVIIEAVIFSRITTNK
jgi:hypothetical protein